MVYPDVTNEVDHNAVKQRIVSTLKLDSTLYNLNNLKGSLAHSVDVGLPDGYNWNSIPFPYIRVTNDPNFEDDQIFGAAVAGTSPYAHVSTSKHTCRYLVIFMASDKSAQALEKTIDLAHKEIKNALKSNLKLVTAAGTNDLGVIQSRPLNSKLVDGGRFKGMTVNGIIIQFQVIIQT